MMNLFNNINNLERSLDTSSLRQRTISNNIANVDTPGYKAMDVSFKDILASEKSKFTKQAPFQGYKTDSKHFEFGQNANEPKIEVEDNTSMLNNENNVDIDYEMTKLAENNIWYNSLTEVMNKEFSMLRHIITEGRR